MSRSLQKPVVGVEDRRENQSIFGIMGETDVFFFLASSLVDGYWQKDKRALPVREDR